MENPNIADHLLLMFSMKAEHTWVNFQHCYEKITRDYGKIKEEELKKIIDDLINKGLVQSKISKGEKFYKRTDKTIPFFEERLKKINQEKLNWTYLIVYKAKKYYPVVSDFLLEFCKDRYVGFYVLFTNQRFFRRNFRGKPIKVENLKQLMFYVDLHYIDIIPCVHRIGKEIPDWLVIDIDPGKKVSFETTKKVAEKTYDIMKEYKLNPVIKFSGSRGFQLWARIKPFEMPSWYRPLQLPGGTERKKDFFSLFADLIRVIQHKVDEILPGKTLAYITLKKEREDKILLDSSSMKLNGLVRAPFGIHSKTGLVSLPLNINEIHNFNPENASIEIAMQEYEKRKKFFILKESDVGMILEELKRI